MTLRRLHFASACTVGLFVAAHLLNHLVGLFGQAHHIALMAALRTVYRQPLVEALLLAALAWQVASGLTLVARGWRDRRGTIAWLQAASGLYIALFLAVHVSAVLMGRSAGLDTNFNFGAAGMHVPRWPWFFVPYYALAVASLITHISCAIYWRSGGQRPCIVIIGATAGLAMGAAIVASLAGAFSPVTIPALYFAPYGSQ